MPGARPWRALNVNKSNLKETLALIGSQWSPSSTGICSDLVTSLAAVFCMHCSLFNSVPGGA